MDILQQMQKDSGATLVMVTHSKQMASKLDKSFVMSDSGILEVEN